MSVRLMRAIGLDTLPIDGLTRFGFARDHISANESLASAPPNYPAEVVRGYSVAGQWRLPGQPYFITGVTDSFGKSPCTRPIRPPPAATAVCWTAAGPTAPMPMPILPGLEAPGAPSIPSCPTRCAADHQRPERFLITDT